MAFVYPTLMAPPNPDIEYRTLQQINTHIHDSLQTLPGSLPYDNIRPINVPGRFDGFSLFDVMCQLHPHIGAETWREIFAAGRISQNGQPIKGDRRIRGGEQFSHLFPNTVEQDVNAAIQAVYYDDALLAIAKPAPLPMHPSGRFNRNTLTSMLKVAFPNDVFLPVHRLDANTSGIVVLARNRKIARIVQLLFDEGTVKKKYLAICQGHPAEDHFECHASITKERGRAGRRITCPDGLAALTKFTVVERCDDGTCRIEAVPITGRTNQIRVHMWTLGMPILGDPLYLPDQQLGESQTLVLGSQPMCLHATSIALRHPTTNMPQQFNAPPPNWW